MLTQLILQDQRPESAILMAAEHFLPNDTLAKMQNLGFTS